MKKDSRIVYEKTQCLRAEVYKNAGYFFASIVGIAIVKTFIYQESFLYYLNSKGIMILICALASLQLIGISITILEELDAIIHIRKKEV